MKTPTCRLTVLLLCGATLLSISAARAQSTATSAAPESQDEPVLLSPFEVQSDVDRGYVATSSLAGSRLNTPLSLTPVAISVMTSELIADIGATNIKEAMEYATGAGNDIGDFTGNNLTRQDFQFQIRGYRNVQATREYFPTLIASDAFNIDRIDIARGPNSILFGIGGAGGIIDATPKRAVPTRDFNQVQVYTGSWDKYRLSLDLNQSLLNKKLGVRANLLWQDAEGWRDFEMDDQRRGALSIVSTPTSSTSIRFQGEVGKLEQNRVRPWAPYERFSEWRANGSNVFGFGTPEVAETPGGPHTQWDNNVPGGKLTSFGFSRVGVLTDAGGNPLNHQSQWFGLSNAFGSPSQGQRFYRVSSAPNLAGFNNPANLDDESLFPRTGNPVGPGNITETDYDLFSIFVDQSVGRNLHFQLAASRQHVQTLHREPVGFANISLAYDVTTTLPTFNSDHSWRGTLSPYAVDTPVGPLGGFNFDSTVPNPYVGQFMIYGNPSYSRSDDTQEDYRLSGTYTLDLGEKLGRHNFLGFVSRSEAERFSESFFEVNLAPDRPAQSIYSNLNPVVRMAHVNPFSSSLAERGMPDPWSNPIPSGRLWGAPQYGFQDGWAQDSLGTVWTKIDSASVALQSSFLNNRIVTTGGVRRDSIKAWQTDVIGDWGGTDMITGAERRPDPDTDEAKSTYTVGAVGGITDWLSVYGNTSTNFKDQPAATLYGDQNDQPLVGPLQGSGADAGLKFKLLDDRVYATLGWFKVEQTNQATGFNGLVDSYIDAIWTAIANNGPGTDIEDPHRADGGDTQATVAEGYEFELVANFTPNWHLMFNVSNAENVTSGVDARLVQYVDTNTPEWNNHRGLKYNASADPGNVGDNTVGALVDDLQNIIAIDQARNGQQEVNARPWSANLFTSYRFSSGPLRNFTIGGGVNYRGDAILGVDTSDPLNYRMVKGHSYYLVNAMAGYEFKIGPKLKTKIQLNVENLMDNDDLQVLASNFQGNTTNMLTYYFEPRRYSISATFDF